MPTRVLKLDPRSPDPELLREAAQVLRRGGLVAFPTETVYGLGANALDDAATARIFAAKGRPPNNPLIVHVAEPAAARELVADWPPLAQRLAERFWPGPLSLVLPRHGTISSLVTGGGPTVAIRCPAHPVARGLLAATGLPLAAPSANRSSELSPTLAEHVLRGLKGRIDLVLDAGPTPAGIESTVLDVTSSPPRILRAGPITASELEAAGVLCLPLPSGERAGVRGPAGEAGTPLPSPGMLQRHYAPRTPLVPAVDGRELVEAALARGERVGWLTWHESSPGQGRQGDGERLVQLTMPRDAVAYASQLYAALHVLDDSHVARIIVDLPPAEEAWLAIRDRLSRAAQR